MTQLETQVIRCSSRVPETVALPPLTIITIMTTVLPMILRCFNGGDETDPAKISAAVRARNAANPKRLHKRTTRRVLFDSPTELTKEQAGVIAAAIIAEACEIQPSEMLSLCGEVMP